MKNTPPVALALCLYGLLSAAPAPVFRGPAPFVEGEHVASWKYHSGEGDEPGAGWDGGWYGDYRPDGSIRETATTLGRSSWSFDPDTRLFTIDFPQEGVKVVAHVGTGDGHQVERVGGRLLLRISGFAIRPAGAGR